MKNKQIDVAELRKKHNLTQRELAEILSVHERTVQNWEKGTKIPSVKHTILQQLWDQETLPNNIVGLKSKNDVRELDKIRERKLFGSEQKGIIAVPIKAQANYSKNFSDAVFQEELERIYFPNSPYDGDDYRFFQIEGDSMEYIDEATQRVAGIEDGSWVIAERIPQEDWPENLRQYYVYVIVTKNRITLKRILQDNASEIVLHADNELYGQERLPLSEVKEIWIFRRKLDWSAPPPRRIEIKV